jgi:TRAP transporter TAXI family solute receptor
MHDCSVARTSAHRRRVASSFFVAVINATALFASSLAHADDDIFRDKFISLGTSSRSGVYHVVGTGLCNAVNLERSTSLMRCVAYNTVGSEYNAEAVAYGELSMGITLPDIAYAEFKKRQSNDKRGADLRAVMSLHSKPVVMLARRAAHITDATQIVGHSINLGNRGSGQRVVVESIMKALELTSADFSATSELHTTEMGKAFCAGKVDVIVESLGNTASFYKKMIEQCDGMIVSFPPKIIDKLLIQNPLMSRLSIPGGLYAGYPQPVPTFGYRALLVTSAKVSDQAVQRFVASVMHELPDLKKSDPALNELDADIMFTDGIVIPLHQGVINYLNNRKTVSAYVDPISH